MHNYFLFFPGKGSVRGRSALTPRMKQTVGQLLTYDHELRDLSNQVRWGNPVSQPFGLLVPHFRLKILAQ